MLIIFVSSIVVIVGDVIACAWADGIKVKKSFNLCATDGINTSSSEGLNP